MLKSTHLGDKNPPHNLGYRRRLLTANSLPSDA
jgi:hypothetical protein